MAKVIGDITLYTVRELAESLDITDITIRRYIKDGKLKATKLGGKYHISEEALRQLIDGDSDNQVKEESAN